MALPQQAIERLMNDPSQTQGTYGQLLMFSGTIFFISIVVALGLMFGYEPYLNSKRDDLRSQVQQFSDKIPRAEQELLASSYSQLINLQTLLANHGVVSPLLDWLNAATHPNIYYSSMRYAALTRQVGLNGTAKSFSDVAEQIAIFERNSRVKRVVITNAAAATMDNVNIVSFGMTVTLNNDLFKVSGSSPAPTLPSMP